MERTSSPIPELVSKQQDQKKERVSQHRETLDKCQSGESSLHNDNRSSGTKNKGCATKDKQCSQGLCPTEKIR